MLNSVTSIRLELLRFPLIVGVVFIHAYETTVVYAKGSVWLGLYNNHWISELIRNLISQEIARTAVPTFFLISGYLFFTGFIWSKNNYLNKLKSRTRSLLIPFLFWNIFTLILIALGQSLSITQVYFSGKNPFISSFDMFDYIRYIFGIGVNPIAYQFWFIRDLILLVLLSPFILFLNKKLPEIYIPALFYCWLFSTSLPFIPSIEAILFFSIGCLLAILKKDIFGLDAYGKAILALYVLMITTHLALDTHFSFFHKINLILGVLSALFITKFLANSPIAKNSLLSLSTSSFFVYAAHEPLLSLFRKLGFKIIQPNTDYLILTLYLIIPIIVISILVIAYNRMILFFPQFTRLITGGR